MWLLKKAYYRTFQFLMGLGMKCIPWIEPVVIYGADSIKKLPPVIKEKGITGVLVVTDPGLMGHHLLDSLFEGLNSVGVKYSLYDQVQPNPTIDNIEAALKVYNENNCQAIIAFGGGSPMDCAKVTGARVARPNRSVTQMRGLFKVIPFAIKMGSLLPPTLFAVPTTAGTGSETTIAAVVSDSQTHEKYPITDPVIRPRYAVLDPLLTVGLPPHITSTTGIDALTHAVESYIGKFYNNKDTRKKAILAVEMVFNNIERAYYNGKDLEARGQMLLAAYYGGYTFTRGGVGNIHCIGHNLGGMYGVPHGLAMSVIMPYVLEWYGEAVHKPLAELADVANVSKPGMSQSQKAGAFIEAIKALNKKLNIPNKFDFIKDEDIPTIAERALLECNPTYPVPKIMSKEDCMTVIRSLKSITNKIIKEKVHVMKKPYMGKILIVDLSIGTMMEETIPDHVYEQYLSGMGLGAHILYNHIPAGADPLGPENILGFCSGFLTGTGSLFSGRWTLVGKSPLTGCWGDANCGGTFSPAIKHCGYDAIFFKGISSSPVYLYVKNGKATLKDAADFWGCDAVETEDMLKKRYGPKAAVAVIGPAGEKVSLISGVCTDRGRIAARSGLGAVMGIKKLKAVVLDGVQRISAHDPAAMKRLSKQCIKWVNMPLPLTPGGIFAYVGSLLRVTPVIFPQDGLLYKSILKKWGTGGMNQASIEMGDAPLKNWNGSNRDFPLKKSKKINPDLIKKTEIVKYHCYSCPLGCGGICATKGKYSHTHKPEYESILALGGLCMNEDLDSLFYLNELLNRAGMDTISAGSTVAFAIECYEKGILNKEDTGGLELKWGNTEAIIALIKKMVEREGIGDFLADGTKIAAAKIGKGTNEFAIQAGGQELAMHDGRNDPGFNVHYSVEPSPGRHTLGAQLYYEMFQLWKCIKGLPKPSPLYTKASKYKVDREKAVTAAACSKFMSLSNGAGMCLFGLFLGAKRIPTFDWLNAATGWQLTPEEYMTIGERIQTMKQAFNVKHGIEPRDNFISNRAQGKVPQKEGANKGRSVDVEKLATDYWDVFGWDKATGKPKEETLRKLEIKK